MMLKYELRRLTYHCVCHRVGERERDKDTHVSRDLIAIYRMLLIGLYNLMRILNVHIHIFTNLSLFISELVYFYF